MSNRQRSQQTVAWFLSSTTLQQKQPNRNQEELKIIMGRLNLSAMRLSVLSLMLQAFAYAQDSNSTTMRAVMWEETLYRLQSVISQDQPFRLLQTLLFRLLHRLSAAQIYTSTTAVAGGTEVPYSLGHEAVGVITEVGSAVQKFKVGDRILVPTDPDPDVLLVGPQLVPTTIATMDLGILPGI